MTSFTARKEVGGEAQHWSAISAQYLPQTLAQEVTFTWIPFFGGDRISQVYIESEFIKAHVCLLCLLGSDTEYLHGTTAKLKHLLSWPALFRPQGNVSLTMYIWNKRWDSTPCTSHLGLRLYHFRTAVHFEMKDGQIQMPMNICEWRWTELLMKDLTVKMLKEEKR